MLSFQKILPSLFGIFLFLASSSAYGQFNVQDCNSDVTFCSAILSSTSSSSTALAGGLIFTAVLGADQTTTMRKFLRQNRVALLADISVGSGELLADFAYLIGVPEKQVAHFTSRLGYHRDAFTRRMSLAIKGQQDAEEFINWLSELEFRPSGVAG